MVPVSDLRIALREPGGPLANTLVSVRRVTQHNTGRRTPGVDRQVALTSEDRVSLAMRLHRQAEGRKREGNSVLFFFFKMSLVRESVSIKRVMRVMMLSVDERR